MTGLIDEMALQIEKQSATILDTARFPPFFRIHCRSVALEARLEPIDIFQSAVIDELLEREEIIVPAAILENAQRSHGRPAQGDQVLAILAACGERFIHNHGQPSLKGGCGLRGVKPSRRSDDRQIEPIGTAEQLLW